MVSVGPLAFISGFLSKVGVNKRLFESSLRSTSSSNVSVISFPLKLVVESPGSARTSCGGMESLGPPAGGTMLAQPVEPTVHKIAHVTIIRVERSRFLMRGKHTAFVRQISSPSVNNAQKFGG